MTSDPWHLKNIYENANASTKAALHARLKLWHGCKEDTCP